MKFSESWLRERVDPSIDTATLVDQLTMAGLEVDAFEPVTDDFTGVIVGEIVNVKAHPNADKLRVCEVSGLKEGVSTVVCGAPNARLGLKAPFATVGAVLPGNFKIKKAKLRGVESCGMLCGQTELKAGDDDTGLWELPDDAPVGKDLRAYLQLDDMIVDVDLTPNRGDCLSIEGLAREVGVLNRAEVNALAFERVTAESDASLAIDLLAPDACPRYFGRVIEGLDANVASPLWLQEKLRRCDVRPIDAIVDITNYVLLELGQPMHAFDSEKIDAGIVVRFAKEGEILKLLNDQVVNLTASSLVIADQAQVLALAGVMGGSASAVSRATKSIFLESAFFQPVAIAGKARDLGLHTDASHRYERGVDYKLAEYAMERASQLIVDICGGKAGPMICAEHAAHLPQDRSVILRKKSIESGLGFAIVESEVEDIMSRLGLKQVKTDAESWSFAVPSYRFDISIEADLLEELARIYGYNNLPTTINSAPLHLPNKSETRVTKETVCARLVARDYQEVITYSFIDPDLHQLLSGGTEALQLMNPISRDLSVMRTSLIPGLLQTLNHNLKRQHTRVRLFETGLSFHIDKHSALTQKERLAGIIYGARDTVSWVSGKDNVDFYDLKGDVESLTSLLDPTGNRRFEFSPCEAIGFLHPGQTAELYEGTQLLGYLGAIHPRVAKHFGLSKSAFAFELDLSLLLRATVPAYSGISRHPEVERDLAFLVKRDVSAATLKKAIISAAGENMKQLKVFDIYSGEGIDSERKSIAFHLTFQHSSRTLNENEVNTAVSAVTQKLEGNFDATLR